jgi:hypothetical protein
MFFFEKKNQKTFAIGMTLMEKSATAVQKFFASFFKKEGLQAWSSRSRISATTSSNIFVVRRLVEVL